MLNVFITGISGFVGSHVVDKLLAREDIKIFGLILPKDKNLPFLKNPKIKLIEGDILSKESVYNFLNQNVEGNRIVIHIAGMISVYKKNDPLAYNINVNGTINMVDVSIEMGIERFIYISSVDSLNRKEPGMLVKEQDSYNKDEVIGVYSKSKAHANQYILDKCKECGFPGIILCPSAILGPDDPFMAPINQSLDKYYHKKLPAIVKGGYDLVDVRDVAEGIVLAMDKGNIGQSYLLTGTSISLVDLFKLCGQILKRKPVRIIIPYFVIYIISPFIELFAKMRHKRPLFTSFSMSCLKQNPNYSHQKASDELGYIHRDLKGSLVDTFAWIENKSK